MCVSLRSVLLLDADDGACDASACIASGEGELMTALAEVIHVLVQDDGATDHGMLMKQVRQRQMSRDEQRARCHSAELQFMC
jgi:hypothetical protein